jgi:hypothetical protein
MLAYADQNFIINCANNRDWRKAVTLARDRDRATLVLSPWHFYEIGTISEARMEELVQVVEEFRPAWILDRSDLQLRECIHAWQTFWGEKVDDFKPIGTLAEVAAILLRSNPKQLADFALRDYVRVFQRSAGAAQLLSVLDHQRVISAENRVSYKNGKITTRIETAIEQRFVAQMLARREEKGPSKSELDRRTNELLTTQPIATKIAIFIEWGGTADIKTYKVEAELTSRHFETDAVLNVNRQIDRQHAAVALPYCDCFVTSDNELLRRCEAVRERLAFRIATVQTGGDFVHSLAVGS